MPAPPLHEWRRAGLRPFASAAPDKEGVAIQHGHVCVAVRVCPPGVRPPRGAETHDEWGRREVRRKRSYLTSPEIQRVRLMIETFVPEKRANSLQSVPHDICSNESSRRREAGVKARYRKNALAGPISPPDGSCGTSQNILDNYSWEHC